MCRDGWAQCARVWEPFHAGVSEGMGVAFFSY